MCRGDFISSASLTCGWIAAESRSDSKSVRCGPSDLSVDLFVDILRGDVDFLKSRTGEI